MSLPDWLAATRRFLADQPGEWSDDDLIRYHREGFSPQQAATELAVRGMLAG